MSDAAVAALRTLADKLLATHNPSWTVGDRTFTNRVLVSEEDMTADLRLGHECVPQGQIDGCEPGVEHYVEACNECRQCDLDGNDGYLLWPCPTVRAVREALAALEPTLEPVDG